MTDPVALRVFIWDRLLAEGAPPTLARIADAFGITSEQARADVANLKIGKTVLPHPETGEVWMAGPFSASPTPYPVGKWFANCAWDMLGIPLLSGESAQIDSRCECCHEEIELTAYPDRAPLGAGVVHILLPARQWYDDIGFT